MRKLTYLLVGSVFLGAQILAIDVGIAKLSMYRLILLLMTSLIVIMIFKNDSRLNFTSNLMSKNYTRFYFFWLLYALISVIWIKDITAWVNAIFFLGSGCLSMYYMGIFIRTEKDMNRIFQTIAVMITMHNFIGWAEIITGKYLFANLDKLDRYNTFSSQPNTRIPISIYANQNDFATMLLAGITVIYILYITSKKYSFKFLYLMIIFSSIFLLYKTDSRANLLGLILGIIVLLFLKYFSLFNVRTFIKLLTIGMITFILAYLFSPFLQDKVTSIMVNLQTSVFVEGNSNMTRVNLIRNGFYFLVKSFGFGTGAGNVEYWMQHYPSFATGTIYNIHNWWMEILTGYGVVVFILYMFVYVLMLRQLYVNYKFADNQFISKTSAVFLAYMFSFFMSSISSASNILIEWQWVFWGVIVTFIRFSEGTSMKEMYATRSILKSDIELKIKDKFYKGGRKWKFKRL